MTTYFIPLFYLPTIVVEPGHYLPRAGERVLVERVSSRHDFNCTGRYASCGTAERWHKTGRIMATSETPNDIVKRL